MKKTIILIMYILLMKIGFSYIGYPIYDYNHYGKPIYTNNEYYYNISNLYEKAGYFLYSTSVKPLVGDFDINIDGYETAYYDENNAKLYFYDKDFNLINSYSISTNIKYTQIININNRDYILALGKTLYNGKYVYSFSLYGINGLITNSLNNATNPLYRAYGSEIKNIFDVVHDIDKYEIWYYETNTTQTPNTIIQIEYILNDTTLNFEFHNSKIIANATLVEKPIVEIPNNYRYAIIGLNKVILLDGTRSFYAFLNQSGVDEVIPITINGHRYIVTRDRLTINLYNSDKNSSDYINSISSKSFYVCELGGAQSETNIYDGSINAFDYDNDNNDEIIFFETNSEVRGSYNNEWLYGSYLHFCAFIYDFQTDSTTEVDLYNSPNYYYSNTDIVSRVYANSYKPFIYKNNNYYYVLFGGIEKGSYNAPTYFGLFKFNLSSQTLMGYYLKSTTSYDNSNSNIEFVETDDDDVIETILLIPKTSDDKQYFYLYKVNLTETNLTISDYETIQYNNNYKIWANYTNVDDDIITNATCTYYYGSDSGELIYNNTSKLYEKIILFDKRNESYTIKCKKSNYQTKSETDTFNIEGLPNLCEGVSCNSFCDGSTYYYNGYCDENTGNCIYDVEYNSSLCSGTGGGTGDGATSSICGDGICGIFETCESCAIDCGECNEIGINTNDNSISKATSYVTTNILEPFINNFWLKILWFILVLMSVIIVIVLLRRVAGVLA